MNGILRAVAFSFCQKSRSTVVRSRFILSASAGVKSWAMGFPYGPAPVAMQDPAGS